MSLDTNILNNIGGTSQNSLCDILNELNEVDDDNGSISLLKHSPYYDNSITDYLKKNKDKFTILSSNIDSIYSKFSDIETFINNLYDQDLSFSCICFQECRITDESNLSLIQLPNYNCISSGKTCSSKGGLIIYLHELYDFKLKNYIPRSTVWESQIIEINSCQLRRKITLCNIYRPPRDLFDNYKIFYKELSDFLTKIENINT